MENEPLARVGDCQHGGPRQASTTKTLVQMRTTTQGCASGFTLVEILVAIAVLLTITSLAVPILLSSIDRAKEARAIADIHTIGNAVTAYQVINQQFPDSLDQVGYGSNLDPWGQPYQYLNFADVNGRGKMRKDRFLVPINSYFDLYSMGKDGKSVPPLTAAASKDDVIWANDGGFVGLASDY